VVLDFTRQHLIGQLATIERHIIQGETNVTTQRCRVDEAESSGKRAALSRTLLANFEAALRMRYQHRDSILREMAGEFEPLAFNNRTRNDDSISAICALELKVLKT
jgi:hypothetical protein